MKYWLIVALTLILQNILTLKYTALTTKSLEKARLFITSHKFGKYLEKKPITYEWGQAVSSVIPGYVLNHKTFTNWFLKGEDKTPKIMIEFFSDPIYKIDTKNGNNDSLTGTKPTRYKNLEIPEGFKVYKFIFDESNCAGPGLICYREDAEGFHRYQFYSDLKEKELIQALEKANTEKIQKLVEMALANKDIISEFQRNVKQLLMHLDLLDIANADNDYFNEIRKLLVLPKHLAYVKEKKIKIFEFIGMKFSGGSANWEGVLEEDLENFSPSHTLPSNVDRIKKNKKPDQEYDDSKLRVYIMNIIQKRYKEWTGRDFSPKSDLDDIDKEITIIVKPVNKPDEAELFILSVIDLLLKQALEDYSNLLIRRLFEKYKKKTKLEDLNKYKLREIFYETIDNAILKKDLLTKHKDGFTVYAKAETKKTLFGGSKKHCKSYLDPLVYIIQQGPEIIPSILNAFSLNELTGELEKLMGNIKMTRKRD
jgi:hypothetical protein